MIKYFVVENYRSIKNKNCLEFDSNLVENFPYPAHPVIGFAGANASGKTSILQALSFVLWFMKDSFFGIETDKEIPLEPFHTTQDLPTYFHLIFSKEFHEDRLIKYEYQLSLTKEKVLFEELKDEEGKLVYRRWGDKTEFGQDISPIDTKDIRNNCSIISYASQFSSQKIAINCKRRYNFYSNLGSKGLKDERFYQGILGELLKDEEVKSDVKGFLKIADIGIEDVYIQEIGIDEFLKSLEEKKDSSQDKLLKEVVELAKRGVSIELIGIPVKKMLFKHKIDAGLVDFFPEQESSGTLQFLTILYRVINALKLGELLILDEIEIKLHQNLVTYLIGLFKNPAMNKHHAQLLFSCHNTYFMEVLQPEQLWFAQKNDQGQTELFSAAAFSHIKDLQEKNLEILYRTGIFGAKPRET